MKNSYRRWRAFQILKVLIVTVIVMAFFVVVLWGCLFTTDYIMFKNNRTTVFTNAHVEQTENGKVIYEDGVFYYVVTNEKEQKTFYLFNKEINI